MPDIVVTLSQEAVKRAGLRVGSRRVPASDGCGVAGVASRPLDRIKRYETAAPMPTSTSTNIVNTGQRRETLDS